MSWSIGYDNRWKRDIGYDVPAWCDYPGCGEKIDRGLAHVCGGEPYGGEHGCGLYFCPAHISILVGHQLCERCESQQDSFEKTPDHPEWVNHKLTDPSWKEWREANPEACAALSNGELCSVRKT